MNDTIFKLAEMLGVATNQLMGYYMKRAPLEWIDVAMVGVFLVGALACLVAAIRYKSEDKFSDTPFFLQLIAGLILGGVLVVFGAEVTDAVKSQFAPEAYAMDQILRVIGQ